MKENSNFSAAASEGNNKEAGSELWTLQNNIRIIREKDIRDFMSDVSFV